MAFWICLALLIAVVIVTAVISTMSHRKRNRYYDSLDCATDAYLISTALNHDCESSCDLDCDVVLDLFD